MHQWNCNTGVRLALNTIIFMCTHDLSYFMMINEFKGFSLF